MTLFEKTIEWANKWYSTSGPARGVLQMRDELVTLRARVAELERLAVETMKRDLIERASLQASAAYWWDRWRAHTLMLESRGESLKPSFCEECMTEQRGDEWVHTAGCIAAAAPRPNRILRKMLAEAFHRGNQLDNGCDPEDYVNDLLGHEPTTEGEKG